MNKSNERMNEWMNKSNERMNYRIVLYWMNEWKNKSNEW